MLRTTTACTFSTSQLPKVVRTWCVLYILTSKCASRHNRVHFFNISTAKSGPDLVCFVHFDFEMCFALRSWCVLYILTWKCASRHNGVQFFISHLASWLRTRRFSEPTFRPTGATNHWKNTVFRDFPTFSRICIFFLLILVSSDSSHLCFSTIHIVGSFTSKLPSIILFRGKILRETLFPSREEMIRCSHGGHPAETCGPNVLRELPHQLVPGKTICRNQQPNLEVSSFSKTPSNTLQEFKPLDSSQKNHVCHSSPYPLVNVYVTMENRPVFHGKIHD